MDFLLLFWEYFKIGLFTIGGGYAMLPLVSQTVAEHGWLTQEQLINFVGIAESTPGPFAINLATFVGIQVGGATELGVFGSILGAIVATFAVVLPSLVIIMVVTKLFQKFSNSKIVQGVLFGVRPVVVGLILSAVVGVGLGVVLPGIDLQQMGAVGAKQFAANIASGQTQFNFNWVSLVLIGAFAPLHFVKIKGKKIHPILLIVLSAVVGIVVFGVCGVTQ